jgi:hypothetical protein
LSDFVVFNDGMTAGKSESCCQIEISYSRA